MACALSCSMYWGTVIPCFSASAASCLCMIAICSGVGCWPGCSGGPGIGGPCGGPCALILERVNGKGEEGCWCLIVVVVAIVGGVMTVSVGANASTKLLKPHRHPESWNGPKGKRYSAGAHVMTLRTLKSLRAIRPRQLPTSTKKKFHTQPDKSGHDTFAASTPLA